MTQFDFLLIVFTECCAIAGQIFFKHAMCAEHGTPQRTAIKLAAGVSVLAVNFFLWTGLLSKFDLSYLYPFDGLSRVLLMLAAWIFLKEKMTVELWVGVTLICSGVLLVSRS